MNSVLIIVAISVAGPIIGSLIGVIKKPSEKFIYNMLSFAAGVMLSISFLELIPESIKFSSILICIIGIITGALIMFLIDKFTPHIHPQVYDQEKGRSLKKVAVYLIVGMFLHNFPEGMAIAIDAVAGIKVSITIALAIAIHNIPEGICTSAPYFHSTGNRLKSFLLSSSTSIPLLIGFLFAHNLYKYISLGAVGFIVAATAGLMIFISTDELIPTSFKSASHSDIVSFIIGVLLVVSLGAI